MRKAAAQTVIRGFAPRGRLRSNSVIAKDLVLEGLPSFRKVVCLSYLSLQHMARTKRDSVLPPARLHKAELEWLKSQANQRHMSLSEYLRLRLLHPGKLRRVSTGKREQGEKQARKNAYRVPQGENRLIAEYEREGWCGHVREC